MALKQPKRSRLPGHEEEHGARISPKRYKVDDSAVSSSDVLCKLCRNVQWSLLTESSPIYAAGRVLMKVTKSHDELLTSACRVCRALASIKPASLDDEAKACNLTAFSSCTALSSSNNPKYLGKDCTVVGFVPKGSPYTISRRLGFLAVMKSDLIENFAIGPRIIHPHAVDYSLVKELMSLCGQKHRKYCLAASTTKIPGLRVLDCRTRCVIAAPENCQYFALSYVWGKQRAESKRTSELQFPAVVEDTITVTLALGFRYLWVDRYCVDQDDDKKHQIISQMGVVYSNAHLTIIAAAGESAEYGLPGISTTHRQRQHILTVKNCTLVQVFPHGIAALEASKWATRAWTYQEGYLSRRRLIFTNQQVLFLCNGIYASESVKVPIVPDTLNSFGNLPFLSFIPRANSFVGGERYSPSHPRSSIERQIGEYTKRHLSFEADALNGFLGVLRHFASSKTMPIAHLWGIPIIPETQLNGSQRAVLLAWRHKSPATRRPAFPSWSWTGWAGPVDFFNQFNENEDFQVSVSIEPGRLMRLAEFIKNCSSPHAGDHWRVDLSPKRLHITAPTFELKFSVFNLTEQQISTLTSFRYRLREKINTLQRPRAAGLLAVFNVTEEIAACAVPFFDDIVNPEDEFLGLLNYAGHREYENSFRGQRILILKRVEDHYERVGIISLVYIGQDFDDLPMLYVDRAGNILDEVAFLDQGPSAWLNNLERRTIFLE